MPCEVEGRGRGGASQSWDGWQRGASGLGGDAGEEEEEGVEVEKGVRDHGGGDAAGALVGEGEDNRERDEGQETREAVVVGPVDVKGGEDRAGKEQRDEAGDARAEEAEEGGAEKQFLSDGCDEHGEDDHHGEKHGRVGLRKQPEQILLLSGQAGEVEEVERDEVDGRDDRQSDQKGDESGGEDAARKGGPERRVAEIERGEGGAEEEAELKSGAVDDGFRIRRKIERGEKKSGGEGGDEAGSGDEGGAEKKIADRNGPGRELRRMGTEAGAGGGRQDETPEEDDAEDEKREFEEGDGERRRVFRHARATSAGENGSGGKRGAEQS